MENILGELQKTKSYNNYELYKKALEMIQYIIEDQNTKRAQNILETIIQQNEIRKGKQDTLLITQVLLLHSNQVMKAVQNNDYTKICFNRRKDTKYLYICWNYREIYYDYRDTNILIPETINNYPVEIEESNESYGKCLKQMLKDSKEELLNIETKLILRKDTPIALNYTNKIIQSNKNIVDAIKTKYNQKKATIEIYTLNGTHRTISIEDFMINYSSPYFNYDDYFRLVKLLEDKNEIMQQKEYNQRCLKAENLKNLNSLEQLHDYQYIKLQVTNQNIFKTILEEQEEFKNIAKNMR